VLAANTANITKCAITSSFRIKKIIRKLSRLDVPQTDLDYLAKFEDVTMTTAKIPSKQ